MRDKVVKKVAIRLFYIKVELAQKLHLKKVSNMNTLT